MADSYMMCERGVTVPVSIF